MQISHLVRRVALWLGVTTLAILAWSLLDPRKSLAQIVLTVVVIQAVVVAGMLFQRPTARTIGDWRYLRPGPLLWLAVGLTTPVSMLLFLVYVGTDWSRYPHGDQSGAVLTLACGFGAGAAWAGIQIITSSLRWDECVIEQRTATLRVRRMAWRDVTKAIPSEAARTLTLLARDGTMIRVPLDAHGLGDFLADAGRLAVELLHPDEARMPARRGAITRTPAAR